MSQVWIPASGHSLTRDELKKVGIAIKLILDGEIADPVSRGLLFVNMVHLALKHKQPYCGEAHGGSEDEE